MFFFWWGCRGVVFQCRVLAEGFGVLGSRCSVLAVSAGAGHALSERVKALAGAAFVLVAYSRLSLCGGHA